VANPSCLAFVDSISTTPVVTLDLDDRVYWETQAESTFHSPVMRRSSGGSMLVDGEPDASTSYANREIRLTLKLASDNPDTDASQYQKLIRQLDKTGNILRYTPPGATNPVFFQTLRTSPETVTWDRMDRRCTVVIPAKPFAIGTREDLASSVTVNNDPAAGSNGLLLDVTGVKGDVETPLLMEYTDSSTIGFRPGLVVGVRPGSSPYPAIFRQAESLTQGTDTSTSADATFSGGSKSRVTFATVATMFGRLSGSFPTATVPAGAENIGVYRVFVRAAKTVGGDVIKAQTVVSTVSSAALGPKVIVNAGSTAAAMVDLGTISINDWAPRVPGYGSGTAYRLESTPTVSIQAERTSGSGSLDIDYVLLVPADYRLGAWGAITTATGSADLAVVDSVNESIYGAKATTGTPGLYSGPPTPLVGAFPYVKPGDNRLVMAVTTAASPSTGNVITTVLTMTLRYWPRYTYVRPLAT